jgi:hypothetical protein
MTNFTSTYFSGILEEEKYSVLRNSGCHAGRPVNLPVHSDLNVEQQSCYLLILSFSVKFASIIKS